jgi:hypothetical protein
MIHLVTYSAPNCSISREVCVKAAYANGVDRVYEFTPEDISNEFISNNVEILNTPKGVGLWIWKPYFVNHIANELNEGDILIYCDAGFKLITNVNEIICRMDHDIFLFSNGHSHCHWTKADILKAMLHRDMIEDTYQQVQASLIFFRINNYTRNFIKEWLLFCQIPGLIDDSPSKIPNHPEFAENRYDQSIIGSLAIRENIILHWWPDKLWYESQRYRWPNDTYPSMGNHHRKRNEQWQ